MSRLSIHLLGPPRIELDGRPLVFNRRKNLALLTYLAVTPGAHSRESLTALLWPDYRPDSARANLRRTLSLLNSSLPGGWLAIERDSVELARTGELFVDAARFRSLVAECEPHDHAREEVCPACIEPLAQAAALYRDDFLAGFTLADSPQFDEWQVFQTEHLRRDLRSVLARLVRCHVEQGDLAAALPYAHRRLALDSLDEKAHRALIRLYAWQGDRSAALRQYEECARLLADELGVEPEAETVELRAAIAGGTLPPPPATAAQSPGAHAAPGAAETAAPSPQETVPLLARAGELRLVTVLCAGPAPTPDMDPDPSLAGGDLPALLAQMERIAAAYGAQVERHLGDGILATFGAARVHEDDAERSVQAALQVRDAGAAAGMAVSAGIHTGRVYVDAQGDANGGPAILGPVVTMAARLRDLAAEGEILLSRPAYQLTRMSVRAAARSVSLPGQAQPVAVYALARARRRPRRTRGIEGRRAELVGRGEEMDALAEMLDALQAGTGGVALLAGEAGVGKSRLVEECENLAANAEAPPLWLEGRCLEMTAGTPYAPFAGMLRGSLETGTSPGYRSMAATVRARLQSLVDDGLLSAEQREEIGPLLGRLLALQFGDAWDGALSAADPQQVQYRTFAALKELLAALAQRQPLVVVLEDMHWADDASVDLAAELISVAHERPLLLLCAYRPDEGHRIRQLAGMAARRCPAHWREFKLSALPPSHTRALVLSLLGDAELAPSLLDEILERAEGNPFFVEEIVRSLMESGAVYREGNAWRTRADARLDAIPAGVNSIVLSRIDRLSPLQRQLLRQAAVIGRTFPLPLLAHVTAGIDLDDALAELEEHGFLYLERSLPAPEYSFWHVLTQQAVHDTLPRRERAALHAQVAAAMETLYADALDEHVVELAYHYDRTDEADKAIAYLLRAGEKLRRDYAGDSAIAHFKRALERLDELEKDSPEEGASTAEQQYSALKGIGQIYTGQTELAEAEGALRDALRLADRLSLPLAERVRLIDWLCEAVHWTAGPADASFRDLVLKGKQLLDGTEPSVETAIVNHLDWLSLSHDESGYRGPRTREYAESNERLLRHLPYVEELRSAYFTMACISINKKDPADAKRWIDLLLHRANQRGDLRGVGEAYYAWGASYLAQGDFANALRAVQHCIDTMLRIGDILRADWAASVVVAIHFHLGDFASAEESMAHQAESWDASDLADGVMLRGGFSFVRAAILHATCRREEALALVQSLWPGPHIDLRNPPVGSLSISLLYAKALLHSGQTVQALRVAETALALSQSSVPSVAAAWYGQASSSLMRRPQVEALSVMESAISPPDLFAELTGRLREKYALAHPAFTHWHLESAEPDPAYAHGGEPVPLAQMAWTDPFGDCAQTVDGAGAELRAANGRELWQVNRSAPRLLMPVSGDFALESTVSVARDDRPAMGGLLLWQDEENYLCLNWGQRRPDEIGFEGCIGNEDLVFGRGKLPGDRIRLRLERSGDQVRALCSADGETWYTAGQTEFAVDDEIQAGLYAIGHIDRAVYPGAFPDGTAIRFSDTRRQRPAIDRSARALNESRSSAGPHDRWRFDALKGLGQTYHGRSDLENAEAALREAFELSKQLGLSPDEQVRLVARLGEVLYWRVDFHNWRSLIEEGFGLLPEDDVSVAKAILNQQAWLVDADSVTTTSWTASAHNADNKRILPDLPYTEELRPAYFSVMTLCLNEKDLAATEEWFERFRDGAKERGDLRGTSEALFHWGIALWAQGDLEGALQSIEDSIEAMNRAANFLHSAWYLPVVAHIQLAAGRLEAVRDPLRRRTDTLARGNITERFIVRSGDFIEALLALCEGDSAPALSIMREYWPQQDGAHMAQDAGYIALSLLHAELLLRHDFRDEAIEHLDNALPGILMMKADVAVISCGNAPAMRLRRPMAEALSKFEAACPDPVRFEVRCRELRAEDPDFAPAFTHWRLEPAEPDPAYAHGGEPVPLAQMAWTDPFGDCAHTVDGAGAELRAANGRELWQVNRSAPRLLMPVSGDFALESTVSVARDDRPAMGGLLLWQDEENYLCLNWGQRRPDEIGFEGCIGNEDLVFGRGKLPGDRIRLRLERSGDQVRALCSADGETWYTAGQTEFAVDDEIQAGLYAIGHIDRAVYPGAFPDGTAIRFDGVRLHE